MAKFTMRNVGHEKCMDENFTPNMWPPSSLDLNHPPRHTCVIVGQILCGLVIDHFFFVTDSLNVIKILITFTQIINIFFKIKNFLNIFSNYSLFL